MLLRCASASTSPADPLPLTLPCTLLGGLLTWHWGCSSAGKLLALEAKGCSSKTVRAARQSQTATSILTAQADWPALPEPWKSTYTSRTVYSAVCHDEGFQWVIGPRGIISGSGRKTVVYQSAACKPTAAKASANGGSRVRLPVGVLPLWHNSLMPLATH